MKKRISILIFALSSTLLFISLKLFWNLGIYADEKNTSPSLINGGEFWLAMDWLRLLLLLIICIISFVNMFKVKHN